MMNTATNNTRSAQPRTKRPPAAPHYDITPDYSLASPAGRAAVEALKNELIADPEKAKQFFISAGILTAKGHLAKRYGG